MGMRLRMAGKKSKFTNDHPTREQLAAFLWGQLNVADQEALAGHIGTCDICGRVLREIPDDPLLARLRDANAPASEIDEKTPPPADDEHTVPTELVDHPRYKVGRFLGAGGMGLVFKA